MYTREEQDWSQFKSKRNAVVKLIKDKKKKYYEKTIDNNKGDPSLMWKTLKKLIQGESTKQYINEDIDFELLKGDFKCSAADKFNLYYVLSIDNI